MNNSSESWSIRARWVVPVDEAPLAGGILTIQGERIAAVEPAGSRRADLDAGNAVILPGFVNAHTHLDLSGLAGVCPPGPDFTAWLRSVIDQRRQQTPAQVQQAIAAGIADCLRQGTTLLGDIAAGGESWPLLARSPLRGVVFFELLGLPRARATAALAAAAQWLDAIGSAPTCRPGWSPHAPYSVSRFLMRHAARTAQARRLPLAIHLAETEAERELLEHQAGPFADFLRQVGVWAPAELTQSWEEVLDLLARSGQPLLLAHGNQVSADLVLPAQAAVVYCPRTHAAFGHPPHPFRELGRRGARVALGTDSLASNPDLSILAELRFLHDRHPDVAGDELLRLATVNGAAALGWADETGSLTPGKSADWVVLPLPDVDGDDPYRLILESALPVRQTWIRGQCVYSE
ncbi:MAG: amidohydrolase family protein [Gemmataceae bacterium]